MNQRTLQIDRKVIFEDVEVGELTRETKGRVGGGDGKKSSSRSVSSDLPVDPER